MEQESTIVLAETYRARNNLQVIEPESNGIMAMMQTAINKGMSLETIKELRAMQKEIESDNARKAFVAALSAFKADPLIINKDKHVEFNTSKGLTSYKHASLGNICNIIGAALANHGLSYRWATEQSGKIKVTCTLMHNMGHSESVSLESGADESGGKNSIQAIGSTVSYLQRYTLLAITGTATQEQDDDGKASGFKMGDVMDESKLCDFLAAIEAASNKGEIGKVYLSAIQEASSLKDQDAMDRLNAKKDAALSKLLEKK